VTTIVDMPLNSIPATTTAAAYREKAASAAGVARVDHALWGGVVPGNTAELEGLADAGVVGFKCFLVDSGVAEFPAVSEADLRSALPVLASLELPLLAHAELPGPIAAAQPEAAADARAYNTWLDSRPAAAEVDAVRMMIRLCREHRCRVHIVHVSAAQVLHDLRAAMDEGLPITAETCPHYLVFEAESIADGATQYKCAPPIRGGANREQLWEALREGVLGMIVSDHSPCPPALKRQESGDFMQAWGGIASLELGASAVWTEASTRGFDLPDLARWMCETPARLAGAGEHKGRIEVGFDADLFAWNPDAARTVAAEELLQRHPVTPYAGMRLRGRVERTWVRGRQVHGPEAGGEAVGRLLQGARAAGAR
jgi:allantoinase